VAELEVKNPFDWSEMELWWNIQQFFYYEADLLDTRSFTEWLNLFDEGVTYRMPLTRNFPKGKDGLEYSASGEAAWFDEGIETLRQRVAQLNTGMHWAEEPVSRVSHLVSNIRVLNVDQNKKEVVVKCRFFVYQNRLEDEVNLFVGKREDVLKHTECGWKILRREILLDQNVLLAKALTTFF